MRTLFCLTIAIVLSHNAFAQYNYEPTTEHPFGQLNPEAPTELADFDSLVGSSECKSESRAADGNWNDPVSMVWTFKYIMNGLAVQDETLKEDGAHSGSIRQFNADSAAWYVHYYSSSGAVATLPAWKGRKNENGDIILYREQQAPNGLDGFYKINFTDISEDGFEWLGEWVNADETISYPTWRISCKKTEDG